MHKHLLTAIASLSLSAAGSAEDGWAVNSFIWNDNLPSLFPDN